MSLIYFILLIGPLIFIHEFGHYLAARAFDVRVLQFSIGFGPRLAGFQRGETEWVIGAFPLGGYVRMLGMEPGEAADLPESERKRALWAKPIWQRSIIVLAGPLANLLIPLPIFIAVYTATAERYPPVAGIVTNDSPAERAGIEAGDLIVSIDDEPIEFFDEVASALGDGGEALDVVVRRDGEELALTLTPEMVRGRDRWVQLREVQRPLIGIARYRDRALIHVPQRASPAGRAGLQTFDRVVAVNGVPVGSYSDFESLTATATEPLQLVVMRSRPMAPNLGTLFIEDPVQVELPAGEHLELGYRSAAMVLFDVQPGTPADLAGLRAGDEVLSLDGRAYNVFRTLLGHIQNSEEGEVHELVYLRDGDEHTTQIARVQMEVVGELNQDLTMSFIGMDTLSTASSYLYPWAYEMIPPATMSAGQRLWYGVKTGFEALIGYIVGILIGVIQLVTGQVGFSNLGGPMMIFDIAGRAGSAGIEPFMRIMALISINLGILNLLPIPVLDGGNLMLFGVEAITRRPITTRTRQVVNYVGLVMLVMVFLLVFKNDIERYWSNFAEWFD